MKFYAHVYVPVKAYTAWNRYDSDTTAGLRSPTRSGDCEPVLAVTSAAPDDAVRLYDANSGSGNVGMYQLITPIHTPYSATLIVVRVSIGDTPAERLWSDSCRPRDTAKSLPCSRRRSRC